MSYRPRKSLARTSMGRPSLGGQRRQSSGRQSMGGRRRKSGGRPSQYSMRQKVQDPRPIGNKKYHHKNIRTLITYLSSHFYEQSLSPKLLTAISSNEFKKIVTFLFRQLDPNFEFGEKSFEEELKVYLKRFGYPFTISSNALRSVGSPHTWPALLACLIWVVEFLQYTEEVESKENKQVGADSSERVFFAYLGAAYEKFLSGEDNFESLDDDLRKRFAAKNKHIQSEIAAYEAQRDQLAGDAEALERTKAKISELKTKRTHLQTDLKKFSELISELLKHQEQVNQKVVARKQELVEKEAALEACKAKNVELRALIKSQPFTPMEVQAMNHKKAMLQASIDTLQRERERVQKLIWEEEKAVSKAADSAHESAIAYNETGVTLGLIPHTAKFADGGHYEFRLNADGTDMDAMCSVDLKTAVKPVLAQLKTNLTNNIHQARKQVRLAEDEARTLADSKVEKTERLALVTARLEKLEESYRQEREKMNLDMTAAVNSVEEAEMEVNRLQAQQSNAVDLAKKELEAAKRAHQMAEETCADEKDTLSDELCQLLNQITDFKVSVTERLTEVLEHVDHVHKQIAESEGPALMV